MRSPRGYDVAGVGGGEFALRLVPPQRAAPHYWRSSSHTHDPPPPHPMHNKHVLVVALPLGGLFQLLSGLDKKLFDQLDAKIPPHLGISIAVVVTCLLPIIVVVRALALARAVVAAVVLVVDPD